MSASAPLAALRIRAAAPHDATELAALVAAYWTFEAIEGFEAQRITATLRDFLARPQWGAGWIAQLDGKPAGYLLAVYVFSLEHGGLTAEIDEFFVRPEHRSSGVGAALLRAAEDALRTAGCSNVSLQLAHDNARARAFYVRNGYRARERFELLEKTLTP